MIINKSKIEMLQKHYSDFAKKTNKLYTPENMNTLLKPKLIKNAFSISKNESENIVINLFRQINKYSNNIQQEPIRVYVDGNLNLSAYSDIIKSSPHKNEDVNTWLSRVINSKRYGLVINGIEKWSAEIQDIAFKLVQQIRQSLGEDNTNITISLFIGNYGFTPFGIHLDDPYSSTIHLHLGPAAKAMYLWDDDMFNKQGGKENCFHAEKIKDTAMCFSIESGDFFVLPPNYWHVGEALSFSIAITITIVKETEDSLINMAIKKSSFELKNINDDITVSKWRENSVSLYRLGIKSHCGLLTPFHVNSSRKEINNDEKIILNSHYPLLIETVNNKIYLFSRGNKTQIYDTTLFLKIKLLFEHKAMTLDELKNILAIDDKAFIEQKRIIAWLLSTGSMSYAHSIESEQGINDHLELNYV